jgi:4-carboxymuconolactone decarboxylase
LRLLLTWSCAIFAVAVFVPPAYCEDPALPADVYPQSRSRLPPVKRDDLDEQGKKQYDALIGRTGGRSIAGLTGPGGLNLYSPKAALHLSGLSNYLRYESLLSGRVRETAILTTAREMENQFEWFAHEAVALKEGVPAEVIDVIKHRKAVDDIPEMEAAIIQLGRQAFGDKNVSPEVFARARKFFGDQRLVEMVLLMGSYASIATLLTTFDVQLPPGQKPLMPPRQTISTD